MRRSRAPILLLAFYAAVALPWLIVIPPFDNTDEIAHYDHARYIAATGHLPDHVPAELREGDWYVSHWPQPPLYYLLIAAVIRATDAEAVAPLEFVAFDPADQTVAGPSARRVLFQEPADGLATRTLWFSRLVSAACGGGAVLALFAALGTAGASDRARVLLIASLLLVPAFAANLSAVNNDALAAMLAAAGVAAIFRVAARPESSGLATWFGTGLIVGLALLSKHTTGFLVPMAAASSVMGTPRSWRLTLGRLGALGAGIAICVGALAVRNWIVFGDPFASALTANLRRFHGPPASWTLTSTSLYAELTRTLYDGFVAQFGYALAMPRTTHVWLLYRVVAIGAVILCLIATVGAFTSRLAGPASVRIARLAVIGVIAHVAALYGINTVFNAASGRHLLPAIVPAITLIYFGGVMVARALGRGEWSVVVTRVVPAAILVLLANAWVSVFVEMAMRFRFGG